MTGPNGLVTTDVGRAVAALRAGGLVAMPTETVYGLAADAEQPDAVARVFAAKGRPTGHPLIVHLAPTALEAPGWSGWAGTLTSSAEVLAEACWPGPITLLVERGRRVIDPVTGGRGTVGIRVPAHPLAQELLERLGGGVAAPSANRFGRVSPTTAAHVLADIGPHLDPERDVILDGGASPVGVESTIVDCTTAPPQLLRPGGVTSDELSRLLGEPLAVASGPSRAAGMLASHYAPAAQVILVDDASEAIIMAEELRAAGERAELLDGTADLVTYARTLYASLRAADSVGATHIVAVLPPAVGLGHAIRDRLGKAAHPRSGPVIDPTRPARSRRQ